MIGKCLWSLSHFLSSSAVTIVAAGGSNGTSIRRVSIRLNMAAVRRFFVLELRVDARGREFRERRLRFVFFGYFAVDVARLVAFAQVLPQRDVEIAAAVEEHLHQGQRD